MDEQLLEASSTGDIKSVKDLLDAGANPNFIGKYKNSPLTVASEKGHLDIVKLLLSYGANPEIRDFFKNTPLTLALGNKKFEVAEYLINQGININDKGDHGFTPFTIAIMWNYEKIIQLLINAGADVNLENDLGISPLATAVRFKNVSAVKLLLEAGADPNSRSNADAQFVLIEASEGGILEIFNLLLEYGADPNVRDKKGQTALIAASRKGHINIVKSLMESEDARVGINFQDDHGHTALIDGHGGPSEIIRILLENGADPNIKDNNGYTALMYVSKLYRVENIKLLLNYGADPNIQNRNGDTALIYAASGGGYLEMIEPLLQSGANPNIQNNNGYTALMIAIMKNRLNVVKLIINDDIIFNLKNKMGETIFDIARRIDNYEIMALIDYSHFIKPMFKDKISNDVRVLNINPEHISLLKRYLNKWENYCYQFGIRINPEYIKQIAELMGLKHDSKETSCEEVRYALIDKLEKLDGI